MEAEKGKRENLQDVKVAQTRCQNLSMCKIDDSLFLHVKNQPLAIGQPW
jgi:hypothetical protein